MCSSHGGIRMAVSLCDESPVVSADVALMAQVLVNIVRNSVESIAEKGGGGGLITLATEAVPARITVADNGGGISPDTAQHLFTPFFSTKPNGHGIGLLLIREILIRHHCRFSLRTGNDGMTRFSIEF